MAQVLWGCMGHTSQENPSIGPGVSNVKLRALMALRSLIWGLHTDSWAYVNSASILGGFFETVKVVLVFVFFVLYLLPLKRT